MSDRLEDDLRDWLRERGEADPAAMSAVVARIDTLPSRRRRPSAWLAAAAAVLVVVTVIGVGLVAPRLGGTSAASPAPTPPDPAAFAGDPRLGRCFGGVATPEYVFVMPHARDYQRHFPAMGLSPELDVDDPAFVVVFAADVARNAFPLTGGHGAGGPQATPEPSPGDGSERFVCIVVGDTPNLYEGVDITGMQVDIGTSEALPGPTPSANPASSPAQTPEPAPSWAADLVGQLDCRGEPQAVGGEYGSMEPVGRSPGAASPYPWLYALDDVDLPLEGWVESPKVDWEDGRSDFARFVNETDGRVTAVILMGRATNDWKVVGYRACQPGDFDPLRGRSTFDAPWRDADGVASETVRAVNGPAHCGYESTVWLWVGDALYLRDPAGIFADIEAGPYVASATLPVDAIDSGLSSAGRRLFTTPDGKAVFVRSPAGVERWPRSSDTGLGCT